MFKNLKQWVIFGRLSSNEIIFQRELVDGIEQTVIIIDKWPFLKGDFISCLTMYSAKDSFSWAGFTKNNTLSGDIDRLKNNILSFWDNLNLEHRYDKMPYQEFFIKVIFVLLNNAKIDEKMKSYSDNPAIAIILMLNNWERSLKSNPVPI